MSDRYASLKQGLVGCWIPSVSGSGLLLPDLSGRNNNGVLTNMDASDWVSSQYGRALDFDGSNDYVDTGTQLSFLDGNSEFTMCFWGQRRSSGAALTVGKRSGGNYILIAPWIDGNVYFELSGYFPAVASNLTSWAHYAMTLRGATIRGYINGSQVVSTAGPNTVPSVSANYVMGLEAGVPRYSDGQIDDFRVYSRALTESEIRLLASEPGIGFKRISSSAFATRYAYKPAKPRNYSVIRNRDPNYSTLRQGLVAAYCPSISGQGNVLPDLVGGNHGTLTNMTADDWVSSGDGRALEFDGVNDRVESRAISYQSLPLTIAAWVKPNTVSGVQMLASHYGAEGNRAWYLALINNAPRILVSPDGTLFPYGQGGTVTTDWTHVVGVVGPSAFQIYINGNAVSTTLTGTYPTQIFNSTANIVLGDRATTDTPLNGNLDDVRIYSRALTEPEIKLLASKRGIGLEPRKPKITFADLGVQKTYSVVRVKETDYGTLRQGLVGAWCPSLPSGGSGNTLPDVSGYNNHGSLVNMSPDDWVSGQYGRALDFDGSNDVVSISGSVVYAQNGQPFTASIHAYVRNFTNPYTKLLMLRSDCVGGNAWEFGVSDEAPYLGILIGTNGSYARIKTNTSAATITSGWHHYLVVYNGGDRSQLTSFKIYFDGTLHVNSGAGEFSSTANTSSISLNAGNNRLNGVADDIRIYNRALTDSEIRLLASRPGIGLRQESHRNTFYQFPSGARRKRILTGMP